MRPVAASPSADDADRTPKAASDWYLEISSRRGLFDLPVGELASYRDLLTMLVRRNFVARYKQTVLGPLWLIIQPLLTTGIFTIVFGEIADLSTDGLPQIIFYLSGVTCWTYFATTLTSTSNTFRENAHLFGKVYFPRLLVPFAMAASNALTFVIQFVLLVAVAAWLHVGGDVDGPVFDVSPAVALVPLLLAIMAAASLGLGLIISSMTAKYRDLAYLVTFGVQLLMYATPVIYPLSALPDRYLTLARANPMAHVIEALRLWLFGIGQVTASGLVYAAVVSGMIFLAGAIAFSQVERRFVDTV